MIFKKDKNTDCFYRYRTYFKQLHISMQTPIFQVQPPNSRSLVDSELDRRVLEGFQGCLDSVLLNNKELPLQNKRSLYAEVVELAELKLGCILYPDPCLHQPCRNGATCNTLPSGGESRDCTDITEVLN